MEVISLDKLNNLLESEHCFVKLKSSNGKDCSVCPKMFINFDEGSGNIEFSGYNAELNGKETEFDNFSLLVEFLVDNKIIENGRVSLYLINDNFVTVKEYEEDKEFNNLDMKGLLEKYSTANEFEVVVPYDCDYLSKNNAEIAVNGLEEQTLKSLKATYDSLSKKEKGLIPEFNLFISEVTLEIERELGGEQKNLFMCDRVAKGQTKFSDPLKFVWRAYLELEELQKRKIEVSKMPSDNLGNIDGELESVFKDIKDLFISITPTYSWHSTTTSVLYKLYRFKLNEKSRKWLMQFENDYQIEGFEDLAFYNGKDLVFSSCTHEGFHVDYGKKK